MGAARRKRKMKMIYFVQAAASDLPERFFQFGEIRADSTQHTRARAHETNWIFQIKNYNLIRGNPSFAFLA